ncbi:MAG: RsmB/NOP family class I SAM-dependent RNA methyltransferase [Rhizobiales bacterium]|nr:RsmB/NOP family class I SAM-dependent RNA methyltransferase [Hyphomicrobiales bacterium]
MTPGGRLSAAIEILDEVLSRHRPAGEAARDWGRAHRFAGSGDRTAITNLVNAALRRRQSIAWTMDAETPRALALGALKLSWGLSSEEIAGIADGSGFAPQPLSEDERAVLGVEDRLAEAPDWVVGDYPEWLAPAFSAAFSNRAVEEGRGLAGRAPLDLRVNTLKSDRQQVLKALSRYKAKETKYAPNGLRIALGEGPERIPNVESHALHGRGRFEVQDEGSQIAAELAGAKAGMQVVDYCAGAGGKTLALAASMRNKGQIHAHDASERRLRPIFERLRRSGARNVQVRTGSDPLTDLQSRADLVFVDAPCTGSGVWRRRPDAKWRLRQPMLDQRISEQVEILGQSAQLVRSGGLLVYVTCSVLPAENDQQIDRFLAINQDFGVVAWKEVWAATLGTTRPESASTGDQLLQLTPARHATDGFFVAILKRH